jgi:hypothetical protein
MPFALDSASDGTILMTDLKKAVELQNGKTIREYSHSEAQCLGVGFGPSLERYVLFWFLKGAVLNVYDTDGRKVREVSYPNMFLPRRFEVDSQGDIVVLAVPPQYGERKQGLSSPTLLLHKYDANGRELAHFFPYKENESAGVGLPEFVARSLGRARMAVGTAGEVAIFRPDEKLIYWLDSKGNVVLTVPFSKMITAIGLADGALMVASAKGESLPSPRSGVYATKMTEPRLYQFYKNGRTDELALPADALGITKIDRAGNLIKVLPESITIFSPTN